MQNKKKNEYVLSTESSKIKLNIYRKPLLEDCVEFSCEPTSFFLSISLINYIFGQSFMMAIMNSMGMEFDFDTIYDIKKDPEIVEKVEILLSKAANINKNTSNYLIIRNHIRIDKNEYDSNKMNIFIGFRYALCNDLKDNIKFIKSRSCIFLSFDQKKAIEFAQTCLSVN